MNREQIRQLIQRESLTKESLRLAGRLVRSFEELCALDAQLEENTRKPEDLRLLEEENNRLEQMIRERNAERDKVSKKTEALRVSQHDILADHSNRMRELEATLEAQREETRLLQINLEQLKNKDSEMERLKRKRDGMQMEVRELQDKINSLGDDYQRNTDLLSSLKKFVELLEELETQMEKTMDKIWGGFRNDAFDKMF